ncbi:hypothetical protein CAPTEDRAFT_219192 [Capitella teleta]|uniref:Uncharacterized protein n=1 Tax=Capitella teleta TaxID=283909 RepID=R7TSX3_CAPTE|nr:hypothetical protein CAPTEDRAFT_219192 [Capitella teleta]|eukprot:ELT96707.1 hypothetical protein CAPTEDRAFT_219192 [Capitella teleta]
MAFPKGVPVDPCIGKRGAPLPLSAYKGSGSRLSRGSSTITRNSVAKQTIVTICPRRIQSDTHTDYTVYWSEVVSSRSQHLRTAAGLYVYGLRAIQIAVACVWPSPMLLYNTTIIKSHSTYSLTQKFAKKAYCMNRQTGSATIDSESLSVMRTAFILCLALGTLVLGAPSQSDGEILGDDIIKDELKELVAEDDEQPAMETQSKTAPSTAEFGFNPLTFKLIATLVEQAEVAAEREYAAQLLQAVERNRQEDELQTQTTPEKTTTSTSAPPSEPVMSLAEQEAHKDAVHQKYENRLKAFLQHLPFPLSEREAPLKTEDNDQ